VGFFLRKIFKKKGVRVAKRGGAIEYRDRVERDKVVMSGRRGLDGEIREGASSQKRGGVNSGG